MIQPRPAVYLAFTFVFSVIISGLISVFVSLPLTILLIWILTSKSFQQLPEERLHKFARVFGLSSPSGERAADNRKENSLHRIILHRGGSVDAPENTLQAIQEAAKQGVVGVEIDLQFTADGVGILLHDDTLDRTTNATGDVRLKCFAELEDVNAAAKHKNVGNYKGTVKIPTLEECLKECLRLKLLVFIDCKAFAEETANLINELFNKYPDLYDMAAVCSFHPNIIYKTRMKNPRVITALTYRSMSVSTDSDCVTPRYAGYQHYLYTCLDYFNIWLTYAWSWQLCGNSFLLINKESLCRNEVNWWKNLGVHLLAWTVNSEVEKRFCLDHLQVPIITDGLQAE